MLARLLAQYFVDHQIPFIAFDSDRPHGALLRLYADYTAPFLANDYLTLDHIMEAIVTSEQTILVDLAEQSRDALATCMEESDLLTLAGESGVTARYWHLMDSGHDSVELLRAVLEKYDAGMQYTRVLNQLRGDDFSILRHSGSLEQVQALGIQTMDLKRQHAGTMNNIDAQSGSLWAAQRANTGHGLGLLQRQRLKTWLRLGYREIAKVMG
ncbi:hypothetical protein [Candidatus Igneacidithiobacillus taiwanensis]|uniref:hypothetical protein n=1 Tax=Candidatus Igneacidithiobacillus taiwanensis TaxID=1945924 RepID=UPI00289F7D75|nr:hypothetical protein [Candidatus Igneacidithiobacillus taiwanensis]MCE5360779.1 hypothetical protein [Acidithiobacillus sp.]